MFGHLVPGPIGCMRGAGLPGPGLLQQTFPGMQADAVPAPGCGLQTLRLQGTAVTDCPREDTWPSAEPAARVRRGRAPGRWRRGVPSPAGQVQRPASRSMGKTCLVKYRLWGGLGTLATRIRSASANCRQFSPSP